MVRDPEHRDHARAVAMVLDRVDPVISKQSIDVTHRHEDPDRMALEELKALRKLGTTRDKLLELYGPNGLDRLEMLEAAEIAQRAAAAKVIDGKLIEQRQWLRRDDTPDPAKILKLARQALSSAEYRRKFHMADLARP